MARNHSGQMALYEVLNKDKFNAAQKKELARFAQEKAQPVQPVTIPPQQPRNAEVKQQAVWMKRPGMFGFNSGRVEAYVPYPIAVTVVMALALLLIIVFQVGQTFAKRSAGLASKTGDKSAEVVVNLDTVKAAKEMAHRAAAPVTRHGAVTPAATTMTITTESEAEPVKTSEAKAGEYPIVLAELKNAQNARDMEPAKQYFDEHGIPTEIKNVRGSYFLVTKEKYDGFSRGTPGYAMVEKIKQAGAKYKAPSGYGGFGSKPFSDAYGRKL